MVTDFKRGFWTTCQPHRIFIFFLFLFFSFFSFLFSLFRVFSFTPSHDDDSDDSLGWVDVSSVSSFVIVTFAKVFSLKLQKATMGFVQLLRSLNQTRSQNPFTGKVTNPTLSPSHLKVQFFWIQIRLFYKRLSLFVYLD